MPRYLLLLLLLGVGVVVVVVYDVSMIARRLKKEINGVRRTKYGIVHYGI